MRVLGILILPPDEKSVAPDYKLGPEARVLLQRAHWHALGYVLLRTNRETPADFAAALSLVEQNLLRLFLTTKLYGEESAGYCLTERGREVARIAAAS